MAEKSAISSALRRRPHRLKIDVPQTFPKPFHEYATIKLCVKAQKARKIWVYQGGPYLPRTKK